MVRGSRAEVGVISVDLGPSLGFYFWDGTTLSNDSVTSDNPLYQNAQVARTRSAVDGARTSGKTSSTSEAAVSPELLTVVEVAALLRTSRQAIYAMAERDQLPGKIKLGRRLLFRRRDLFKLLGL